MLGGLTRTRDFGVFAENNLAYLPVLIDGCVALAALLAPQGPFRFRTQPIKWVITGWKFSI